MKILDPRTTRPDNRYLIVGLVVQLLHFAIRNVRLWSKQQLWQRRIYMIRCPFCFHFYCLSDWHLHSSRMENVLTHGKRSCINYRVTPTKWCYIETHATNYSRRCYYTNQTKQQTRRMFLYKLKHTTPRIPIYRHTHCTRRGVVPENT